MSLVVPITLAELRALVANITDLTSVYSLAEVRTAINYGYGKAIRAIRSVNPQHFQAFYDNFSLTVGESEYDLSAIDPPVWRPTRLVVPRIPANQNTTERIVLFAYRDFRSSDFEEREGGASGSYSTFYYDIINGRIPQRNTTDSTAAGTAQVTTQVDTESFKIIDPVPGGISIGQLLSIPGVGAVHTIEGDTGETSRDIPTDYWGTVAAISASGGETTVTVTPEMAVQPSVDDWVTLYRTRVLLLAPAPSVALTGRLWYEHRPAKLVKNSDILDAVCSENRDMIVAYAASWLLRSSNDGQAERWFLEAQEMRSEMMQDIDPIADQNTQALGSGLHGLVGD